MQPPFTTQQFLELLTSPQSVVITEKLARRRGIGLGDEIRLMAGDRVNTFIMAECDLDLVDEARIAVPTLRDLRTDFWMKYYSKPAYDVLA